MFGRCLRRACGGGTLVRRVRLEGGGGRGGVGGRIYDTQASDGMDRMMVLLKEGRMRKPIAKLKARSQSM